MCNLLRLKVKMIKLLNNVSFLKRPSTRSRQLITSRMKYELLARFCVGYYHRFATWNTFVTLASHSTEHSRVSSSTISTSFGSTLRTPIGKSFAKHHPLLHFDQLKPFTFVFSWHANKYFYFRTYIHVDLHVSLPCSRPVKRKHNRLFFKS